MVRMEINRNRPGFIQVVRDDTHTISRWLFGFQQIQIILNANSGDEHVRFFYDACGNVLEGGTEGMTTTNYLEFLNEHSHDK